MTPRDPVDAILAVCTHQLGPLRAVTRQSTDWASATFVGARHRIDFVVDAGAAVARFVAAAAEFDIPLRGAFVADLVVSALIAVDGGERLRLDVLTIDED